MMMKTSNSTSEKEDDFAACDLDLGRVDDILNYIGYGPLQIFAFLLSGLTALAFGMEMVVFGLLDIPIQKEWNLTSVQYAILPSITGAGNIIGGFFYSILCDHYGRVWPYVLIMLHIGVSGIASAFSPNFGILVALRFIVSMGITAASTVMFSTLVEVLPVRNRGKVMVAVLLLQSIGICIICGIAWWILPAFPRYGWRYILAISALPYFIPAVYRMIFSLQSPRFLIARGRYKEAKKVFMLMARINRKKIIINDYSIKHTAAAINEDEDLSVNRGGPLRRKFRRSLVSDLLTIFKPPYLRTTLCMSVIFVTLTSSYFALSIFLPSVLKVFGLDPYFTSFAGYFGQLPGIVLMSIIVEWPGVGRLNSLRFFTLMAMGSFLIFAFVKNDAAVTVSIIFIYFSMVPMISLLYTYISEIYSTRIRAISIGYFVNLSATFSLIMPVFAGFLADVKPRWIYPTTWAGVFLLQFVVSLFLNIETLNRGLSDSPKEN